MTGGSRVDVEDVVSAVADDFENVGMAANHKVDIVSDEQVFHPGSVFSRITAYVDKQHVHLLNAKNIDGVAHIEDVAIVDVAAYGTHHWGNSAKAFEHEEAADVARMPYFVTFGEMLGEFRVEKTVGVGEYAYAFHFFADYREVIMYVRFISLLPYSSIKVARGGNVISRSIVSRRPVIMSVNDAPTGNNSE